MSTKPTERAGLESFIEDAPISFEPAAFTALDDLYAAYLTHCGEVGRPAYSRAGFSRLVVDELPFEVVRARRTPEGYDRQVTGFAGLVLEDG